MTILASIIKVCSTVFLPQISSLVGILSEERRPTAKVAVAYRSKKPLEIYKFFKKDIWVGIG